MLARRIRKTENRSSACVIDSPDGCDDGFYCPMVLHSACAAVLNDMERNPICTQALVITVTAESEIQEHDR